MQAKADVIIGTGAGAVTFGNRRPLALMAGPCAMESRDHALTMAAARADYDLLVLSPDGRLIAQSINGAGRIDRVTLQNRGNSAAPLLVRVLYYSGPSGDTVGAYGLRVNIGR